MTITERNQKLYDLREKMFKLETQLAWVKQEIWIVNDQYDRQDLNLFEEMFGTDVTYTETAYDTPMAEEVYGGWMILHSATIQTCIAILLAYIILRELSQWELHLPSLLLSLVQTLASVLSTLFLKCKIQRWPVFVNQLQLVPVMMKCADTIDSRPSKLSL